MVLAVAFTADVVVDAPMFDDATLIPNNGGAFGSLIFNFKSDIAMLGDDGILLLLPNNSLALSKASSEWAVVKSFHLYPIPSFGCFSKSTERPKKTK
jgi:hypothetical protein